LLLDLASLGVVGSSVPLGEPNIFYVRRLLLAANPVPVAGKLQQPVIDLLDFFT